MPPTPATDKSEKDKAAALRADAVKAWMEADSEDKRRAAVTKFPVLVELYSEAQNYRVQPAVSTPTT